MKLLAIETATRQMGVAAAEDGRVVSSVELLADYPHAVELPGAVNRVLEAAGWQLSDLNAIAVDVGPGSFTGLRIGIAFVKALTFAKKLPVVAVSSGDLLACNAAYAGEIICPFLDAKQKNVYAAQYVFKDNQPQRLSEWFLGKPEEYLAQIKKPAIFVGDGCAVYGELLRKHLGEKAVIASTDCWLPRVAVLARLGFERFQQGQKEDAAGLVPLYLYPLDCSVRGPNRPTSILPASAPATS